MSGPTESLSILFYLLDCMCGRLLYWFTCNIESFVGFNNIRDRLFQLIYCYS